MDKSTSNTRLSVNINKVALLRNARGGDLPSVVGVAKDCERFGAQGITVHPRPDERHITRQDVYDLKEVVTTEYNIEGYPTRDFLDMVLEVKPEQCTLVPDEPGQLTSDHGWDTVKHQSFLTEVIGELHGEGIRTCLFIDPIAQFLEGARNVHADRIEFYTGPYAELYKTDPVRAIEPYIPAANYCRELGLGINAGHDLNLKNLNYFYKHIPALLEVSIGHALISDALYYGLENVVQMYRLRLES